MSLGRLLHLIGLPFVWLLVGLIKVYQYTISPMFGPTCRFHPSCSAYGVGALTVHGPIKGLLLTGFRLCRCNPWNGGGLDPVPAKGAWRPEINPDGTPRADRGVSFPHTTDAGV
ncbi:MAG: membrane protein insertion efficiency factor YidD [Actinomycetes bacterium]